ncbi:MAG: CsgG/HfaB family protein [Thermoanaerobaculia bacterium]
MKSRIAKPFLLVAVLMAVVPLPVRSAERRVVGVAEFENLAGGLFWWHAGTGNELAGLLSDQLAQTDTLAVMSRLEVADAQAAAAGSAGVGRYLVRPAISYYHEQGGSQSSRIRIAGVHIRGRLRGAEIAAELEVIDLATGTRLHSGSLDSRTGGLDLDVGYYEPELSGGRLSQYRDKPAGKAIAKLIAAMAKEIERVLAQAPPSTGVAVASSTAAVNAPGGPAAGRRRSRPRPRGRRAWVSRRTTTGAR